MPTSRIDPPKVTPQSPSGPRTKVVISANDLLPAPRPPLTPGGWVGRRHAGVSRAQLHPVPSSTPADLLSTSPGRPNLFLPVAPGPQHTPQTPTREGREQLLHPPVPLTLLLTALPRGVCSFPPLPAPRQPGHLPGCPRKDLAASAALPAPVQRPPGQEREAVPRTLPGVPCAPWHPVSPLPARHPREQPWCLL